MQRQAGDGEMEDTEVRRRQKDYFNGTKGVYSGQWWPVRPLGPCRSLCALQAPRQALLNSGDHRGKRNHMARSVSWKKWVGLQHGTGERTKWEGRGPLESCNSTWGGWQGDSLGRCGGGRSEACEEEYAKTWFPTEDLVVSGEWLLVCGPGFPFLGQHGSTSLK